MMTQKFTLNVGNINQTYSIDQKSPICFEIDLNGSDWNEKKTTI